MISSPTIVKSQSEFDAAVTAGAEWLRIDSPRGVWIEVSTPCEVDVEASGSSTVRAYGSSTVRAYGSSTVRAYGSSTVRASDSSTVRAYGSSTVRASDSSTVRASDSSTVTAYGSSTVTAYGSSTVTASSHTAVHLHSGHARIDGGVLIDHTDVDLDDVATWLDYKGITVTDGIATFYKAVDSDLNAGHGYTLTQYPIGEVVTAPDWDPRTVCGRGLHATGDPGLSEIYYNGAGRCRYLELAVPVDGLVLLDDKVKFQTCTVVREVTIAATPIAPAASA